MKPEIQIRLAEKSDIPALNHMMQQNYGFTKDESFWIWRFWENPKKKHYSYVAVAGGRVIAHCGGIPTDMQNKGEKFTANLIGDLLTDPEHRIKGTFMRSFLADMEHSEREGDLISFGFANEAGTFVTTVQAKYFRGPMVPRMDKMVNAAPFINRKIRIPLISRLLAVPVNLGLKIAHSLRNPRPVNMQAIQEIDSFDARFDELWERVSIDFPRSIARTSEYLNWRYLKHPLQKYKIFIFVEDGQLKGFIVLRIAQEKDVKRGLLVDLISGIRDLEVGNTLIAKGMDYLIGENVDVITCWMFDHIPYYNTLQKLRFVKRPSDLNLILNFYKEDREVSYWMSPQNWYLTMGNSDIF